MTLAFSNNEETRKKIVDTSARIQEVFTQDCLAIIDVTMSSSSMSSSSSAYFSSSSSMCSLILLLLQVLLLLLTDNDDLRARLDQEARERAQETAALRERLDKECGDLRDKLAKEAEERKVTISCIMPSSYET